MILSFENDDAIKVYMKIRKRGVFVATEDGSVMGEQELRNALKTVKEIGKKESEGKIILLDRWREPKPPRQIGFLKMSCRGNCSGRTIALIYF